MTTFSFLVHWPTVIRALENSTLGFESQLATASCAPITQSIFTSFADRESLRIFCRIHSLHSISNKILHRSTEIPKLRCNARHSRRQVDHFLKLLCTQNWSWSRIVDQPHGADATCHSINYAGHRHDRPMPTITSIFQMCINTPFTSR